VVDYNKRLVEVNVILNHLTKSDYSKIPREVIDTIEKNKDKEYTWIYDETKDLKDQNLNRDTIAIVSYINMRYLLNEKQKKYVKEILKVNQTKIEEIKEKKHSSDSLFKDKKEKTVINNVNISLIEYKEKNFIQRLLKKIKNSIRKSIKK